MRKLLIIFSAIAIALSACQKEASFEDPNSVPGSGGGATGGLLTRQVFVDAGASDSSVVLYTYDASKRITKVETVTSQYNEQISLSRNTAGIISQMVLQNDIVSSNFGVSQITVTMNYSTAESRYKYSKAVIPVGGVSYTDSTAYVYTNGNLANKTSYISAAGSPYIPFSKVDYTFTAGNVTSEKVYEYDNTTSAWNLYYTNTYSYDAKVNPLVLGTDALLIDPLFTYFGFTSASSFGSNNATVINYIDPTDASNNYTLTSTYTYNTANKPTAGTATETPGSGKYNWRFYYN